MVSETDENLEVDLELAEEENLNELSDETEETIESSDEYDSSEFFTPEQKTKAEGGGRRRRTRRRGRR